MVDKSSSHLMNKVIPFIETNAVKMWIEDGLLFGVYKKGSIISLDTAKEIVALRLKFQNGKSYRALVVLPEIGTLTPDARKYLAHEGYQGLEKLAMVTTTKISTLLGNLFITINKPAKPTRLFKNQDDALRWLKQE